MFKFYNKTINEIEADRRSDSVLVELDQQTEDDHYEPVEGGSPVKTGCKPDEDITDFPDHDSHPLSRKSEGVRSDSGKLFALVDLFGQV